MKRTDRLFEKLIKFASTAVLDREELIGKARKWLKELATKIKELHNKKIKPVVFKMGDLVLVQNHHLSSAIKGVIKKFS